MAFEGLLTKLGPTVVRELTPHLMQMVAGFGERFRKDTREIRTAVDAELASVARAHASLSTSLETQRDQLTALQEQLTVLDRKIEILQKSVEVATRQTAAGTSTILNALGSTRAIALGAAVCATLAFGAAMAQMFWHR